MKAIKATFAAIMVATAGCNNAIEPSTATFSGTFVKIDSMVPGVERLGVRSSELSASQLPVGEYNYAVTVRGKLLRQTSDGFQEIALFELPLNSRVLIWTTSADRRMIHQPLEASRVVVPVDSPFTPRH